MALVVLGDIKSGLRLVVLVVVVASVVVFNAKSSNFNDPKIEKCEVVQNVDS